MKVINLLLCLSLSALVSCRHGAAVGDYDRTMSPAEVAAEAAAQDAETRLIEEQNRALQREMRARQEASDRKMLGEIDGNLVVPESYGRTLIISGKSRPITLPPGPMEKLVNQRISMNVKDAGIEDILAVLSSVDGLNIMADESLTETQKIDVNVRDVPLQEVLSFIAHNMGIAFYVGENTIWATASDELTTGPSLETRIFRLRRGFIPGGADGACGGGGRAAAAFGAAGGGGGGGGEDTDLEDALATFIGDDDDDASYQIYPDRNVLIARAPRETMRLIEQLVEELDSCPLQVLIEARFINLTQTDFFELGADLESLVIDTGEKLTIDISSQFPDGVVADTFGGKMAVAGILGDTTYSAILRALQKNDAIKTLTAPKVTVVNNRQATITDARKQYYYEEYDLADIDNGDEGTESRLVPSGSPTELDFGIHLGVRPNIGNDGKTVMLSLLPRITIPDGEGFEEFAVGDTGSVRLPKYFESSVETTVVVESGQTVVLGGTMSHSHSEKVKKVPFLGDIPLLKYLFRHTEKEDNPQHLLIFVTATVISPTGQFAEYEFEE